MCVKDRGSLVDIIEIGLLVHLVCTLDDTLEIYFSVLFSIL